jgi:hypothetical protein
MTLNISRNKLNLSDVKRDGKKSFNSNIFIDVSSLDLSLHPEKTIFSYSIPIFSRNHQYAILIKGFYCGLVCGNGAYYLYKRNGADWIMIKRFNEWAE